MLSKLSHILAELILSSARCGFMKALKWTFGPAHKLILYLISYWSHPHHV